MWIAAMGCGGTDSTMPPLVLDALKDVDAALNQGDAEAACQGLDEVGDALYEWQSFARGNQPVLIEELLGSLTGVTMVCRSADEEETDLEALTERYGDWSSFANRNTKRKSGLSTWAFYIFGPLLAVGFLMYWQRKFREA